MPRKTAADIAHLPKRRAHYIREWRKFRGLSQEALAERADLSPGMISMIENGGQPYTQYTLELIASALGTDPASLLAHDPKSPEAIWASYRKLRPEDKRRADALIEALKNAAE